MSHPEQAGMNASHLAMVYGTYLIATASPGPSTMAIMATAMRDGRGPALALAAGVVTGSLFWAPGGTSYRCRAPVSRS